jgi:hypothetical protein
MIQKNDYFTDRHTIDELMHRSVKFRNTEAYTRFFKFIASFTHYSGYNKMLMYHQNPEITFFGGASYWKKHHSRTIMDGARTYILLAPMHPVLLAYDILETNGRETPEQFLEKGLGRKPFNTEGNINPKVLRHAITITKNLGIRVTYKPLSFFKAGYVTSIFNTPIELVLKEGQTNEVNLVVFFHELAHIFLGHCGHLELTDISKNKSIKLPQRHFLSEATQELEAETVSYLIACKLGLKKNSEETLASYLHKPEDLEQFSYETVIKTADKIENIFIDPKYIPDMLVDGSLELDLQ